MKLAKVLESLQAPSVDAIVERMQPRCSWDLTAPRITISHSNKKLGGIPSVSTLPIVTCPASATCKAECYAVNMLTNGVTFNNRFGSWCRNTYNLVHRPRLFWGEVEKTIAFSRAFRFNVAGDIPDSDFLSHVVTLARIYPHCEILMYTKAYGIVNLYCYNHGGRDAIPQNLHIVLSNWAGMNVMNPFGFPTAEVEYSDGTTTTYNSGSGKAIHCTCQGMTCLDCLVRGAGCWALRDGEHVVFTEHGNGAALRKKKGAKA